MDIRYIFLVQVVFLCASTMAYVDNSDKDSSTSRVIEGNLKHLGLSPLYKLYHKCMKKDTTLQECISVQLVVLLDQVVRKDSIPVIEGINFVEKESSTGRSFSSDEVLTEESLEATLPRSMDARQGVLDGIMMDKISSFFQTHTVQVDLPEARAVRRAGLKIKKMLLPFLMGVVLKGASIIPVILSIMGVLAVKALLLSKAALILTGVLGLRKLFHHGHHGSHGHGHQKHHLLQHDLGVSGISHGIANFMNTLGGHHGHGDSQGDGSQQEPVVYGRAFNSVQDFKAEQKAVRGDRQAKMETQSKQRFTTQIPQVVQNIPFQGLSKTLVVTA